ncbi:MAG: rod shape-determining protein MreC [Alphaproteobacteria bacterium]
MNRTNSRASGTINPLRVFAQRVSFLTSLGIAVALLIFSKIDPGLTGRVQGVLLDVAAPVVEVVGRPVVAARSLVDRMDELTARADEVNVLEGENRRLRQWRDMALRLDAENAQLRTLMQVKRERNIPARTARVISESGGPFLRAVLLNAGEMQGIGHHQPVLDETGLVGRVITLGGRSSRVLLLTDLNSRVPVTIERTGERAILAGDNSTRPRLAFLPMDADVNVGDRVVTSGDGGTFPPRVMVGIVNFAERGVVRIRLAADLSRLDFVTVLAYQPTPPPADEPALAVQPGDDGAAVAVDEQEPPQ